MRARGALEARLRGGRGRVAHTAARGVSHDNGRGGRGVVSIGDRRDEDVREHGGALLLWGECARRRAAASESALALASSRGDTHLVRVADRREELGFRHGGSRADGERTALRGCGHRGRWGGAVLVCACDRLRRWGYGECWSVPVRVRQVLNVAWLGTDDGNKLWARRGGTVGSMQVRE